MVKEFRVSIPFLNPSNSRFLSKEGFLLTTKFYKSTSLLLLKLSKIDIIRVMLNTKVGGPQGIPSYCRSLRDIRESFTVKELEMTLHSLELGNQSKHRSPSHKAILSLSNYGGKVRMISPKSKYLKGFLLKTKLRTLTIIGV